MADDADMTAERAEREAPYLLRAAKKPEGPGPVGYCLFCGEPFEKGSQQRFCDAAETSCRDDFQYQENRKRTMGRSYSD